MDVVDFMSPRAPLWRLVKGRLKCLLLLLNLLLNLLLLLLLLLLNYLLS